MTEEQIRQNALIYATENYGEYDEYDYTDHSGSNMCHTVAEKAFIAGAHSRDEEVELLKKKLKIYLEKEEEEKQKAWAESWGKDDWGFC